MTQPIKNSPSPPELPPTSLNVRFSMVRAYQRVTAPLSKFLTLKWQNALQRSNNQVLYLREETTLVENFQAMEVSVKRLHCVPVLLLLALSFLLACQKPSSTENPSQAATGGAAGSATSAAGTKGEAKKSAAEP